MARTRYKLQKIMGLMTDLLNRLVYLKMENHHKKLSCACLKSYLLFQTCMMPHFIDRIVTYRE